MDTGSYHPIRQRMVVVLIVQLLFQALAYAGIQITEGWYEWAIGAVDVLVLVGVLYAGTKSAEQNTTPLDDVGDPLNPEYMHVGDGV